MSKKKKPATSYDREVARVFAAFDAVGDIMDLPLEPGDLILLARRLREVADELCEFLDRAARKPPQERDSSAIVEGVARYLALAATRITKFLLRCSKVCPEEIRSSVEVADEWPALAAIDPAKDIRRVNRAPHGPAGKLYRPILKDLGARRLFPSAGSARETTVFHRLAIQASEIFSLFLPRGPIYRAMGLPSLLDYSDGSKLYIFDHRDPNSFHSEGCDNREWAIALKYYLYLALAPEPGRQMLGETWRAVRLEAFENFRPENPSEEPRYRELLMREPLAVTLDDFPSNRQELEYPPFPRNFWSRKPSWELWWEETLQYEPAVLFGRVNPLVEWSDKDVMKIVGGKAAGGRLTTAFARCVDHTLDALLHLRGIKEGLKAIVGGNDGRLPRITQKAFVPLAGHS